ncbi:MAG: exopolysaccharide Pel transporter PelG, partial [Clostridia bacterium]|nr:exopolysaccharide Pel transporter PelG [Clostridia bacterium]
MAGTGFELKKIYKKENVVKSALGIAYSTLVTIGPTVLIIFAILILYFFLGTSSMEYKQRELLSSIVLYSFIFSVLLTSLYNVVLSKLVTESASFKSEIADSFYMGLAICCTIASVAFVPMGWELALGKSMDINFVVAAYIQWVSLVVMFFSLTYLNVAKDYKVITSIFILGAVLTFTLGVACQSFFGSDLMHAMLYGLAAGFFFIATFSFAYIKRYFKASSAFSEGLKYAWSFKKLMFANFFYILGLYIHNMVFWSTPGRLFVTSNHYSYQPYDMASCLAIFTNISMLIGFIYMVENRFHKSYRECMEGVAGGTYRMIEKSKKKMFRTIYQQISQVLG